jgi:hypothetical protein
MFVPAHGLQATRKVENVCQCGNIVAWVGEGQHNGQTFYQGMVFMAGASQPCGYGLPFTEREEARANVRYLLGMDQYEPSDQPYWLCHCKVED